MSGDPYDLNNIQLAADQTPERHAIVPRKIQKRRRHFVQVPWDWFEALDGATGQTYRLAMYLLYLHWKDGGGPIKLANGMLQIDGVSRQSKWRALADLERRGLLSVERHRRRSPVVQLNLSHP
jgi:hypothetical protein